MNFIISHWGFKTHHLHPFSHLFPYAFPIFFAWMSYECPMIFQRFPIDLYGFPRFFPWISYDFPRFSHDSQGFSQAFPRRIRVKATPLVCAMRSARLRSLAEPQRLRWEKSMASVLIHRFDCVYQNWSGYHLWYYQNLCVYTIRFYIYIESWCI